MEAASEFCGWVKGNLLVACTIRLLFLSLLNKNCLYVIINWRIAKKIILVIRMNYFG